MKKNLWCAITLIAIVCTKTFAQTPLVNATTNDNVASPSTIVGACTSVTNAFNTDVVNTGTSICEISGGTTTCQVMVWDKVLTRDAVTGYPLTSTSVFSWDYNGTKGSITYSPNVYYDPDVVVQKEATNVWVIVVMENLSTGNINWFRYKWVSGTFVQQNTGTCRNNIALIARNPNIDVSGISEGPVALVWHEEGNYTNPPQLTLTTIIPPATIPTTIYNGTIPVTRAEILLAYTSITGQLSASCTPPGLTLTNGNTLGYLISPATSTQHPFEKNIYPDVTISDALSVDGTLIVTATWLQVWFNPGTFGFNQQLMTAQMLNPYYNCPINITYQAFNCDINARPRIDSRMGTTGSNQSDYSVVMSSSSTYCVCPNTTITSSKLYNYVKQNNIIVNTLNVNGLPDPILLNTTFTNKQLFDPAVAYRNTTGDYSIVWANNNGTTPLLDVIARTYNSGIAAGSVTGYSIVNKGSTCNGNTTNGNQQAPSIANPPTSVSTTMAYVFWDAWQTTSPTKNFIAYKKSAVLAGGATGLRIIDPTSTSSDDTYTAFERDILFEAMPNPFTNDITFNYAITNLNEKPEFIEVVTLEGKQVYKINLKETNASVTWTPSDLKSGSYIVRLTTSLKTYSTKISKK